MEKILESIKGVVHREPLEGSVKWLFLKSHGDNLSNYNDYDLFVIVEDSVSIIMTSRKLSKIAVSLTLILNKYVTIYPIFEHEFIGMRSQFLKNLNNKGMIL